MEYGECSDGAGMKAADHSRSTGRIPATTRGNCVQKRSTILAGARVSPDGAGPGRRATRRRAASKGRLRGDVLENLGEKKPGL